MSRENIENGREALKPMVRQLKLLSMCMKLHSHASHIKAAELLGSHKTHG